MSYLLDTNVISEPRSLQPNENVLEWLDSVPQSELYVSVFTLGELWKGVINLLGRNSPEDEAKAGDLANWIRDTMTTFGDQILPANGDIAVTWGELIIAWEEVIQKAKESGRTPSIMDSWILATAKVNELTVVTRNVRHMSDLGVPVINPWEK